MGFIRIPITAIGFSAALIGLLIWGIRTWRTQQVEKPDYQIHEVHRTEVY